jgi:hypothetical protein
MTAATAGTLSDGIFIIDGHGSETLVDYNTRSKMPPGYTLVTFAECAAISFLEVTIAKVVNAFLDPSNKDKLMTPTISELKKLFGDKGKEETPHIYKEGYPYPKLSCEFFLDWDYPDDRSKHIVSKSGLYKFPLNGTVDDYLKKTTINVDAGSLKSFKKEGVEEIKKLYEGAVFPSQEQLDSTIDPEKYRTLYISEFRRKLTLPIEKIFEIGGPGVYYWVICRGLGDTEVSVNQYHEKLYGYNPEMAGRYAPYLTSQFGSNWIRNYENIKKLMNANAASNLLPAGKKPKLASIRNQINATVDKVRKIRRSSIHTANSGSAGGTRRKTRRNPKRNQRN